MYILTNLFSLHVSGLLVYHKIKPILISWRSRKLFFCLSRPNDVHCSCKMNNYQFIIPKTILINIDNCHIGYNNLARIFIKKYMYDNRFFICIINTTLLYFCHIVKYLQNLSNRTWQLILKKCSPLSVVTIFQNLNFYVVILLNIS